MFFIYVNKSGVIQCIWISLSTLWKCRVSLLVPDLWAKNSM